MHLSLGPGLRLSRLPNKCFFLVQNANFPLLREYEFQRILTFPKKRK